MGSACATRRVVVTVQDMDMNAFWDIAGWIGAALVVGAYATVSITARTNTGTHVMNFVGAVLLLVASAVKDAWFSVALNAVWIVIAAAALSRTAISFLRR